MEFSSSKLSFFFCIFHAEVIYIIYLKNTADFSLSSVIFFFLTFLFVFADGKVKNDSS